jgi:lipopolysaccharide heptosyltransferase II
LPETSGERLDSHPDILNEDFAVLSPGGAKPFRRWPIHNFLELADRFHSQGMDVVIIGDNQEKDMLDGRKDKLPEGTLNLIGETNLEQLISLIRKAKIVVANDSGPMHLANSLNVPVVGIFGSGDVVRTRPYLMEKARIVESPAMDCKPCYNQNCDSQKCMQEITVDRVWEAVSDLL